MTIAKTLSVRYLGIAVTAAGMLFALASSAQSLFYLNSPLPGSTFTRTDGPYIVGNSFVVGAEAVVVDKLGVYDLGNNGFLTSPIDVGLWSEDGTTLIASAKVASSDPIDGGYRYHALPAIVTLRENTIYLIGARIGGPVEPFLCADQSDVSPVIVENSRITRLETRWNVGDTLVAPVNVDGFNGRWGPANASLVIVEPVTPQIVVHPQGGKRLQGDSITLSAAATGNPSPRYQWYKNKNVLVAGATNNVLTFTNLIIADSGSYTMVATNSVGSVTSAPALITVVNPATDITSGLVLWLRFDETSGTIPADASGLGHSASLLGFAEGNGHWVGGRSGNAVKLAGGPGVTNVVLVPDTGDLDFASSQEFSISMWARGSAAQRNSATLIVKGNGGTEQYAIDEWDGNYRFFCRAGGGYTVLSTPVRPDGTWQHIVGVFSYPLNRFKLYVNGAEVASGTPTGQMFPSSHDLSIGSKQGGPEIYDNPFAGQLDDVRIYSRALTPSDVVELLGQAPPIAPKISFQPVGGEFCVGDTVSLRVGAEGTHPMKYQWLKDGSAIANATNSTLLLPFLNASHGGSYSVEITNLQGQIVSGGSTISLRHPNQGRLISDIMALGNRNDFSGTIGSQFTVQSNALSVVALGYEDADGNGFNSAHQMAIWDTNGTVLGSVTLPAGLQATLEGAWRYGALSSPLVLSPGFTYYIGVEVFAGDGDGFTDSVMPAPFVPNPCGIIEMATWAGGFAQPINNGGSLRWFPANMRFTLPLAPSLSITRSGPQVTVSWDAQLSGWSLESSDSLGGSWTKVQGLVNNSVTLAPNSAEQRFYRLRRD